MKQADPQARKTGRPLSFDRATVLEKAMQAFWRSGYETTSITDLTAAMGITAPSLYGSFGDKRQLFLEAMHLYAGSLDDQKKNLAEAPTARDAVHRMMIAAAAAFTSKATPKGCLLASATASGSENSADVQAAVAEVRRKIERCICERIERDVASHLLPTKTNSASLAAMVIAVIQGMSVLARDGHSYEKLVGVVDTAIMAWPT